MKRVSAIFPGLAPAAAKRENSANSFNVMYNAFKRLSRSYSGDERSNLFHDTAARAYRIET